MGKPLMTVGMAVYDDYDGVYFTVQALRMYHPEVVDDLEILIVDNHPDGRDAEELRRLGDLSGVRYEPVGEPRGTSVRGKVFELARTEYVVCLDCHVLVAPGALGRLLDFFQSGQHSKALLHGPILWDDLNEGMVSTHWGPTWHGGMFGHWATDERGVDPEGEPFEIEMQGLGLFACRKDVWPGFNARMYGFGAEEGYIQEKFRQAGGYALCIPFLRWTHRFGRPGGVPFPNSFDERVRNYVIAWHEVGWSLDPVMQHFEEVMGKSELNATIARIIVEL